MNGLIRKYESVLVGWESCARRIHNVGHLFTQGMTTACFLFATTVLSSINPVFSATVDQHSWKKISLARGTLVAVGGRVLPESISLPIGLIPLGNKALVTQIVEHPKQIRFSLYYPAAGQTRLLQWLQGFPKNFGLPRSSTRIIEKPRYIRSRGLWSYNIVAGTPKSSFQLHAVLWKQLPTREEVENDAYASELTTAMSSADSPIPHDRGFVQLSFYFHSIVGRGVPANVRRRRRDFSAYRRTRP